MSVYVFQLRRGLAAEWTTDNPVLRAGEPGVETDTNRMKLGDGVQSWNTLDYFPNTEDLVSGVATVDGRSGVVTLTDLYAAISHTHTKSQVGLANVDNTSDASKPISTATQTALDGKSDTTHNHDSRYYTETETDTLLSGKASTGHTHPVSPAIVILTDAATIAVDATLGEKFRVVLTGDHTLGNPTGAVDGQTLLFELVQDGTGGQTLTLGTKYNDPNGYFAGQSTAAGKRDKLGVQYNATADKFDVLAFAAGY